MTLHSEIRSYVAVLRRVAMRSIEPLRGAFLILAEHLENILARYPEAK